MVWVTGIIWLTAQLYAWLASSASCTFGDSLQEMSDDSEYDLQARIPGTLQHEFILEGTSSSSSFYPRETLKLANALLLRDGGAEGIA